MFRTTGGLVMATLVASLFGCERKTTTTDVQTPSDDAVVAAIDVPEPEQQIDAGSFCDEVFGARAKAVRAQCKGDPHVDAHDVLAREARQAKESCEEHLGAAVRGGRARLTARGAEACAAAVRGAPWRETFFTRRVPVWLEGCAGAVEGRQAVSEACSASFECAPGLSCQGNQAAVDAGMVSESRLSDDANSIASRWSELDGALGAPAAGPTEEEVHRILAELGDQPAVLGVLTSAADAPASLGALGSGHSKVQTGGANVVGRLDPDIIRRVIRQHVGRLRFCYENQLRTSPDLQGTVMVHFGIAPSGAVSFVRAEPGGLPPVVVNCLAATFKRMRFPAPEGGGAVTVSFPITFAHAGDDVSGPSAPTDAPEVAPPEEPEEPRMACAPKKPSRGCASRADCPTGQYCARAGAEGECMPLHETGDDCDSSEECAGACGKAGKCIALCGAG